MSEHSQQTVGILGVGLLGSALVERLRAAGFPVVGYDPDPAAAERIESLGGQARESAQAVVDQAPRTVLCLPDSHVVREVLGGLRTLGTTKLIIDTTTGAPEDAETSARELAEHGVRYIDATIAGSSTVTRGGEALVMVGGDKEDLALAEDVLTAISPHSQHVGPVGAGARMKLVVNLALGLHRAVLAEALALGVGLGLEAQRVVDVLRVSPASSKMMELKGDKMVARDFTPQARLRQHAKDVDLMLAAAENCGLALPLSAQHARLLAQLLDAGYGEEDNTAILRAYLPD